MHMETSIKNLLAALHRPPGPQESLGDILAAAPPVGALPPPQVTWLLLGILHYLRRKRWALDVVGKRLRARAMHQKSGHAENVLGTPLGIDEGVVPGLPDWKYKLSDSVSSLVHRGTGEYIGVSLHQQPGGLFFGELELRRVREGQSGPEEQRLRELSPSGVGLGPALWELAHAGAVHLDPEDPDAWLVPDIAVAEHSDAAADFLAAWADAGRRPALAAWVGDWPACATARGREAGTEAGVAARADECRRAWLRRLRRHHRREGSLTSGLLYAFAEVGADELPALIEQSITDITLCRDALAIIRDDPSWCPTVFDRVMRPGTKITFDLYDANVVTPAGEFLCRHGYRRGEVVERLLGMDHPPYDFLLRVMADEPGRLREVVRAALRAIQPHYRLAAAAVLAHHDAEWCRQELIALLSESDDLDSTVECRAALRLSRDPGAQRAADGWEQNHPDPGDVPQLSARFVYNLRGGIGKSLTDKMVELFPGV